MARRAVCPESENDARVLNGFVRKIELSADTGHIRPLRIHQQLLDPVHGNDLRVIVEKQDILAVRGGGTGVVYLRIVESLTGLLRRSALRRILILHDKDTIPVRTARQFRIVFCRGLLRAAVLDDDDLIILIRRLVQNRGDAALQVLRVIAVRDNNGHQRVALYLIGDLEDRLKGTRTGDAEIFEPMAAQMIRHRAARRLNGIALRADIARGRSGVLPPVVQQLRNMDDMLCLVREAQDHVVILTAVVLGAVKLLALQQMAVKRRQVADIVIGPQRVDGIVRLEMHRHEMVEIVLPERRLITVQIVRVLFVDGLHIPVEHRRVQIVVMIKRREKVSGCEGHARVRVGRDAAVLREPDIADPPREILIPALHCMDHLLHIGVVCIRPVRETELPVPVGLPDHGIHHIGEILLRRVVERHENGEENLSRESGCLLRLSLPLRLVRE